MASNKMDLLPDEKNNKKHYQEYGILKTSISERNKNRSIVAVILVSLLFSAACSRRSSISMTMEGAEFEQERTLISHLEQALALAEKKYGKRDESWEIQGLEFYPQPNPQIMFPDYHIGKKQIKIHLPEHSAGDRKRSLFQLSHEVIHMLSPQIGGASASVLEEGLAVHFSIEYLKKHRYSINPKKYIKEKRYAKAYDQVQRLYNSRPEAEELIESARAEAGSFTAITASRLQARFPGFETEFYVFLVSNFNAAFR